MLLLAASGFGFFERRLECFSVLGHERSGRHEVPYILFPPRVKSPFNDIDHLSVSPSASWVGYRPTST